MTPASIAALVREARALIDAPADDPRRAQFAARKAALLAEDLNTAAYRTDAALEVGPLVDMSRADRRLVALLVEVEQ